MPQTQSEKTILNFYTYPPIGGDDWRYAFETAQVRSLETQLLTAPMLLDLANAQSFQQALELLSGTEYAVPPATTDFAEVEAILRQRRTAIRQLFEQLMLDVRITRLFKSRDDFANLRLAVRRAVTERPIATDYSPDGNVPPEQLELLFAEETDQPLDQLLPDYVRHAAEQAVLAYYHAKDIRQIDYTIDRLQAQYNLQTARKLHSPFLLGLFKIQIDLTNIRTLFRLKFTQAEQQDVFLDGGFVELERFRFGLDLGYEALGPLFFVTPYYRIVDTGAAYLAEHNSFLKLEQQCDQYLAGYLKSTVRITAGPQPIIAYLLTKEKEIRTVRLILMAKKNLLETKLILDRIS